ncbi:MAG TPA: hypothetical protein VF739_00685 [Ktedonobacterales bacterium]
MSLLIIAQGAVIFALQEFADPQLRRLRELELSDFSERWAASEEVRDLFNRAV